jgi:hypothetical protein
MKALVVALLVAAAVVLAPERAACADKQTCVNAYEEGQKQRAAGSLKAALDLFRVCAEADCPAATTKDCTGWVAEVEASIPTVVFAATDAEGKDLVDVAVSIDGLPAIAKLDGKAVPMDPGKHKLRFERTGQPPIDQDIVVRQGEKDRKVAISWAGASGKQDDTSSSEISISPGTWVLGGIGLAGLTVFGVLGGLALSEKSDAEETCAPNCTDSVVDSIRAKLIVADVSLAVGVASLGAAVVLGVMSALEGRDTKPAKASVGFGLAPVEGGAFGVVSGAF